MPSRNTQLTFAWILVAFTMLGIAAWQVQSTLAKDAAARNAPLPPPLKTRHAIRPAATTFIGDPVADYIARCEKGITDQEIRWIIEDFRNAELDVDWRNPELPKIRVLQLINRQQSWYLECLEEGLRLDTAQMHEVRETLGKLFHTAGDAFVADRKNASLGSGSIPTTKNDLDFDWLPGSPVYSAAALESSMPWKLCELSPEQERITWKKWYLSFLKEFAYFGGPSASAQAELTGGPLFRFNHPLILFPEEHATPPDWARRPNLILPILDQQNLIAPSPEEGPFGEPPNTETLLSNIRRLHPAQLKLLLLFVPDMAAEISKELETPDR